MKPEKTEKKTPPRRAVLTPCPPQKECVICEARLNARYGSGNAESKIEKYRHQANELGFDAFHLLFTHPNKAALLYQKAASYANLYLNKIG